MIALSAFLALTGVIQSNQPVLEGVVAGTTAYLMGDISIGYRGKVYDTAWSQNGRYLAIVAEAAERHDENRIGTEILIWDASSGRTKSIWKATRPAQFVETPQWVGSSPVCAFAVFVEDHAFAVMGADAERSTVKELYRAEKPNLTLSTNPRQGIAAITECMARGDQATTYLLDTKLQWRRFLELPAMTSELNWSPDGTTLTVMSYATNPVGDQMPRGTYAADLATGKLTRVGDLFSHEQLIPEKPLDILDTDTFVRSQGRSELGHDPNPPRTASTSPASWNLRGLVLIATRDRGLSDNVALITADGTNPSLADNLSRLAYQSGDTLFIRDIRQMPADRFLALKAEASREKVIMAAKQVALALMMCSMDYDDVFPSNQGWAQTVFPYTKDQKLLDGFNYTFGGGAVPNDKAATTQLGFAQGAGGRAVAYADGHVIWVPDK